MGLTTDTLTIIKNSVLKEIFDTFTHVSFGTGTTAFQEGDTDLEFSLVTVARQEAGTFTSSIIVSGFLTNSQQNGHTITEIGAREGSTGTLRSRNIIDGIVKTSSVEAWVDIETTVTVTQ